MKKFISLIIIFLFYFCAFNLVSCAEDFFIEGNFSEAKEKKEMPVEEVKKTTKKEKKKTWFSKFKKEKKFNYQTNKNEEVPKGYYGKLPDIYSDFQYKKQIEPSSGERNLQQPDSANLNDENLKPAPFDDALFLDVIIKKEKTSQYVNDIQKIKFALNKLKECIEQQGDIQRFNACVNTIELYVKNLSIKYQNKPESQKESYIEILNTNYHAKVLGNLKYDANYYARYIPVNEGQYSQSNILNQEQDLLDKINKTLFYITNEN